MLSSQQQMMVAFLLLTCSDLEECTFVVNGSDAIDESFNVAEEEDDPTPCSFQGNLDLSRNWYGYLANITLKASGGKFYYRFIYPDSNCCVKVSLYLEEQVDKLRASMNCLQKQLVVDPTSPQVITLSPDNSASGCSNNHSVDGQRVIECTSGRLLKSNIELNWYVAASSCGSATGLKLQYLITFYGGTRECPNLYASSAKSIRITSAGWRLPKASPSEIIRYLGILWWNLLCTYLGFAFCMSCGLTL